MNHIDKLKDILKSEGLRYTKQRQQVWDEIRNSSEHRDAEEIYIQTNKVSKTNQNVFETQFKANIDKFSTSFQTTCFQKNIQREKTTKISNT